MHQRRLADDVLHAQPRIQRRVWVLEDHLDFELGITRTIGRQRDDVPPLVTEPALGWRHDTGDHAAERRLAAAGLADQAHDLAAGDTEIDASTAWTTSFFCSVPSRRAIERPRREAAS